MPQAGSLLKTNVLMTTPPTTLGESRIEGAPFPVNRDLTGTHILDLRTTSFNISIYVPNRPISQYEENGIFRGSVRSNHHHGKPVICQNLDG